MTSLPPPCPILTLPRDSSISCSIRLSALYSALTFSVVSSSPSSSSERSSLSGSLNSALSSLSNSSSSCESTHRSRIRQMRKYQNKLMICSKAIGMKICHFILEPFELKHPTADISAQPTMVPSTSLQGAGRPLAPCHCTIVSYSPTLLVEIASPNQLKFGEHRPQDLQVEVVSEVSEQVSTRPFSITLTSRRR